MCPTKAEEEGSKAEDSQVATVDELVEMTPSPKIHSTTKFPESTVVEQSGNKKE